jgi:hypothetical protein
VPKSRNRGKRNTRRRRLAAAEQLHGPDGTDTVHRYPDGWTIRRLTRHEDLQREGHVMHHCLHETAWLFTPEFVALSARAADLPGAPVPNIPVGWLHSLRDTDNYPHATFWRETGEPYDRAFGFTGHGDTRPIRPHYARRLGPWLDGVAIGCSRCPYARPGHCTCIGADL